MPENRNATELRDKNGNVYKVVDYEARSTLSNIYVTPEMFGAVGDGVNDDTSAIQNAVNSGYNIRFGDNKTYYVTSTISINHDCHLFGGKDSVIKSDDGGENGSYYNVFSVAGTLKKSTALTTDYKSVLDNSANSANQFTLSDMTDINIGDVMLVEAPDQYYSYARSNYYLGAALLISDTYNNHIFTSDVIPFDIENTENVTVKIYDAPNVVFENLNFESIYDGIGSYTYQIAIQTGKNCVVRNCKFENIPNGIGFYRCVNSLVDNATLAKAKYVNSISNDSYGITVSSCSNTVIKRTLILCAQSCINIGGTFPCINTYIYDCNLFGQSRAHGLGMHENSYNIVVEDCVLGGASIFGTAIINRCRIVPSKRTESYSGIAFRGSHNPKWATLKITNCIFEGDTTVNITCPSPQSPVQSFENIVGYAEISNCDGGILYYNPSTSAEITGNVIKKLIIDKWRDCQRIVRSEGALIEDCEIINSTFTFPKWCIKYGIASSVWFDGIEYLHIRSDYPQKDKLIVDLVNKGMRYYLPKDVDIVFSSSDSNARYSICGRNIASNEVTDYSVGGVSGSIGSTPTRTVNNTFANALSVNQNGNLVLTYPNSTANVDTYLKCFSYAAEDGLARMSVKLKNIGETDPSTFRAYIMIIDPETGKVKDKVYSSAITATASGAVATREASVSKNDIVQFYIYCSSAVKNSVTEFVEIVAELVTYDDPSEIVYEEYNGSYRTGDGTLKSIKGMNNIMTNAANFEVKFFADLIS